MSFANTLGNGDGGSGGQSRAEVPNQKIMYLERETESGTQYAFIIFDENFENDVMQMLNEHGAIHPMAAIIHADNGLPSQEVKDYLKSYYNYNFDEIEDS